MSLHDKSSINEMTAQDFLERFKDRTRGICLQKHYRKGEYLFHMRDDVAHIFVVESGYVALERINQGDDQKIVFLMGSGSILNEVILDRPVSSIGAFALSEVHVICVSRDMVLQLMREDSELQRYFLHSMTVKIRRLYRQIGNTTGARKLEQQVASKIWKLALEFGEPLFPSDKNLRSAAGESFASSSTVRIPFDLSITLLASMIGTNRESISRVVKKLSADGILSIERGKCIIPDMDRLAVVAQRSRIDRQT